eukprot:3192342-Amphidinium_carterae.1
MKKGFRATPKPERCRMRIESVVKCFTCITQRYGTSISLVTERMLLKSELHKVVVLASSSLTTYEKLIICVLALGLQKCRDLACFSTVIPTRSLEDEQSA